MLTSHKFIAFFALISIGLHLLLRISGDLPYQLEYLPLYASLLYGGGLLIGELLLGLTRGKFGSDMLAGISIVTSAILGEYLAGTIVVLMLSGGEALESYAMAKASSVLDELAKRMPTIAHRRVEQELVEVDVASVKPGDELVVLPHELSPVDGTVIDGQGFMDESYLTGEPYQVSKSAGCSVMSGAVNGDQVLVIRADRPASDSRYAKIMQVMDATRQHRPRIRRLGDTLGALYTPLALLIGIGAYIFSGDPIRFLSVLVVATPCPLLIAIPVAIIGAISLCAKRSIIIKDPAVLEQASQCRTLIFDKTGTLTYGEPVLSNILVAPGIDEAGLLQICASVEQYSRHPLSVPIINAAAERKITMLRASEVQEIPGKGLRAKINDAEIQITGRDKLSPEMAKALPGAAAGLECVLLIDNKYAGLLQFRDEPRKESSLFVKHLPKNHGISELVLLSGDRESEVSYLAERVGITNVHFSKSPEEKVEIVNELNKKGKTMFLGDGINDAPALVASTVGVAFGPKSDITSEAAGAVIMEPSLTRVDEFIHISERLRRIILESVLGGMALSVVGMGFAAAGMLPPVSGALAQEVIDLFAVFNALRTAFRPKVLSHVK